MTQYEDDPRQWSGPIDNMGDAERLLLELSMRYLHRADSLYWLREFPEPHASLQQHLGQTWLRIGRLRSDPAALDSAESHLRLALTLREALPDNVSRIDTRLALAECLRCRARLMPQGSEQRLSTARSVIEAALEQGYCETSDAQRSQLALMASKVAVDIATLRRSPRELSAVLPGLDRISEHFTRNFSPVLHAEAALERQRLRSVLGLLTHDEKLKNWAAVDADDATQSIRRDQSLWIHERANSCHINVLRAGDRQVSLTFPAAW